MKQTVIVLISILFLGPPVVVRAAAPKNNETTWKTLKNNYGNWSISYPSDWKLDDTSGANAFKDPEGSIMGPTSAEAAQEPVGVISIGKIHDASSTTNPKDYIKYWYKIRNSKSLSFSNERKTQIAGIDAIDLLVTDGVGKDAVEIRWIIFKHANSLYKAEYSEVISEAKNIPQKNWRYEAVFEKVLKSLHFGDEKQN